MPGTRTQVPPTPADPTHDAAVWLDPAQVPLAAAMARAAGVRFVGAGSPVVGHSGAVAKDLACEAHDDFRALLATTQARLLLILAPGDFGAGQDAADLAALEAAAARGVKVASIEPIPATLFGQTGVTSPRERAEAPLIQFLPRHRASRPFREAAEILAQLEGPRVLAVEAWSTPIAGSLGAALFSSMDLVHALMGEPRLVDAVHLPVAGTAGRGPDSLRDLHGDLTATLRFEDARACTLVLSDVGARWNRAATLTSARGRFRLFDDGFEWIGPDGAKLDELRPRSGETAESPDGHAVEAIARGVREVLDGPTPDLPAMQEAVMVLCETALLSARTSQPESPETIRRMHTGTALG